jgi:hypothetical protein
MKALETFREAGLGARHISKLAGVSRVTASLWLNGHCNPHVLLQEKVNLLAEIIDAALASGKLPMPQGVSKSEEVKIIDDLFSEIKTS